HGRLDGIGHRRARLALVRGPLHQIRWKHHAERDPGHPLTKSQPHGDGIGRMVAREEWLGENLSGLGSSEDLTPSSPKPPSLSSLPCEVPRGEGVERLPRRPGRVTTRVLMKAQVT